MEFQVDCCSAEEARALMASDAYAANPIGVSFDPEELVARLRGGEMADTLLIQRPGPASPIPIAHGMG